ncbi:MAG: helix-turn-helix domain-containing protein, partial [Oscillospiraceae bacterium]|nr:helix-turn-helix domain-containing protein [Oscillospiraceae bacterium]
MNIGKQIKSLRLQRSITQEQLAQKLNVTSQAVCKWENGNSMPDITLLPEISALFGVTIDELFGLNEEVHFKRIDSLLRNELEISDNDFAYAKDFLNSRDYTGQTATRLARLYNARANMCRQKAKFHAENAFQAEVGDDINHSILCEAANGVVWDWNVTNHHELIDFYYE